MRSPTLGKELCPTLLVIAVLDPRVFQSRNLVKGGVIIIEPQRHVRRGSCGTLLASNRLT